LVDEATARAALPDGWPSGPLPQWVRLLANFPKAGVARAESLRASEQSETLTPRLKAQIAWISARHDRAWYALGHARARLAELGVSDDAIFALGDADAEVTPAERAALDFTRKLTVDPALIDDDDFTKLRSLYSDREVAELVYQITNAAFFNRLTEVSGLRLEDGARQ
jgi:alkylhydroperoxidase family enzyme